jgi:nucleotide-binding universal stress UspA family protein
MPSILVVSDLTHAADEAIRGAASLGRRMGSALHVVHFPAQVTLPAREAEVRRDGALLRAAADALDHQLRRSLPPGAVTGGRRIDLGVPHRAILDQARTVDAGLVVLTPHPVWPADARRLGPVLRHLVAGAALPILVVRAPVAWPARHVLVPVDQGDLSLGTLERACTWLHGAGCTGPDARPTEVEVLHVSDGIREWRDVAPRLEREVRAAEEAAWRRGARVRRCVRWGAVPARRIVEVAGYTGTDLVVLSPRGGHAGEGAWEWVVQRSPGNVLLLPGIRAGPGRAPAADRTRSRSADAEEQPGGEPVYPQTVSPG